ncbi:ABC transporter substrate-binding protein [Myxococcota bacterium]|nr:ABC transporter substrate-binding protein [Myxococcota bacterium]
MKRFIPLFLISLALSLPAQAQTPCVPEMGAPPEKGAAPEKCRIAAGDAATITPSQKITSFQAQVKSDIRKGLTDAQKQAFLNRMHDYFDFSTMAEAALFGEWEKLTIEQRAQFSLAFTAMLQRNYLRKLYSHAEYLASITGEKLKEDKAQVATRLVKSAKGSTSVDVTYRMQKTKQGWRIYDVLTDEVSLIRNYRSTFADLIKSKGFSGLMDHLKKQAAGPLP